MAGKQREIIEAATKLMSERGYHGASMQMIAEKVGIRKSTIFHHFKDKEAILLAILDETVPQATHRLLLIVNDKHLAPMQKLQQFIRVHMKMVEEQGQILNLYLGESRHLSKQNRHLYMESRRIYTNLVKQIISEVQQDESIACGFRNLSPTIVAHGILGMCNWAIQWYRRGAGLDVLTIADQFCHIITGMDIDTVSMNMLPLNMSKGRL